MKYVKGLILLIVLSGIVTAASPFAQQTSFSNGFNIKIPEKEIFKIGEGYNFQFHIYNISNGVPIYSGAGCYFHLYNQTGGHQYIKYQNQTESIFDYDFPVAGSNFSALGTYYYNVQCNNTVLGGYAGEYIYVTAQGVPYSTAHGLLYVSMFVLLIGLFIFIIFFMFSIDANNYTNGDGKVIAINWKKYLKIFLFAIAYVTFIAISYFAWNISYGILEFTEMENFFKFIFRTSFVLIYPMIVVIIIISVAQFIKDKKVEEFIKRNLSFK